MRRFDLKTGTGIDFAHFGLESGMVFEGTTAVSQGLNVFQMNKKQRIICEFEMYLRNLLLVFQSQQLNVTTSRSENEYGFYRGQF